MLVVDTVSPEVEFYLSVVPGSLVYYHPNAYGKAVLAFMKEEEIKQILPTRLSGLTSNTIVMRTELISALANTRKTGLAYDDEEYTSGIFCIGAPVFDVEGNPIAGLGTTCLLSTIDKTKKALFEQLVLECAFRVSKDIGYTGGFFKDKILPRRDQYAS
jgi:DNA-binding IclR family transcriptional regulator